MDEKAFVYWLQGFFELSESKTLSEKQVQIIKEHLDLVFNKVTPNHNKNISPPKEIDSCKLLSGHYYKSNKIFYAYENFYDNKCKSTSIDGPFFLLATRFMDYGTYKSYMFHIFYNNKHLSTEIQEKDLSDFTIVDENLINPNPSAPSTDPYDFRWGPIPDVFKKFTKGMPNFDGMSTCDEKQKLCSVTTEPSFGSDRQTASKFGMGIEEMTNPTKTYCSVESPVMISASNLMISASSQMFGVNNNCPLMHPTCSRTHYVYDPDNTAEENKKLLELGFGTKTCQIDSGSTDPKIGTKAYDYSDGKIIGKTNENYSISWYKVNEGSTYEEAKLDLSKHATPISTEPIKCEYEERHNIRCVVHRNSKFFDNENVVYLNDKNKIYYNNLRCSMTC